MSNLSILFSIVTVVYNNGINLKILMSHNNSFQNCPMYGVACQCYDSTSDSPQISASPYQLDFTLYASGSYNAQWNAPGLLHDKHTLRSSRILGEMEVDEPWLGLWLPLNYQVDMGASQHRTLELG